MFSFDPQKNKLEDHVREYTEEEMAETYISTHIPF